MSCGAIAELLNIVTVEANKYRGHLNIIMLREEGSRSQCDTVTHGGTGGCSVDTSRTHLKFATFRNCEKRPSYYITSQGDNGRTPLRPLQNFDLGYSILSNSLQDNHVTMDVLMKILNFTRNNQYTKKCDMVIEWPSIVNLSASGLIVFRKFLRVHINSCKFH